MSKEQPKNNHASKTILVVEDSPDPGIAVIQLLRQAQSSMPVCTRWLDRRFGKKIPSRA